MNSVANKEYEYHLELYQSFIKHKKEAKSFNDQFETNFSLFDSVHNFYTRKFGFKKSEKQDVFLVIILVSSFIYIIFLIKLLIFDILNHLIRYYTFKKIHRKYKIFFLKQVELLIKEKEDLKIENQTCNLQSNCLNEIIVKDNNLKQKSLEPLISNQENMKTSHNDSSSIIETNSIDEYKLDIKSFKNSLEKNSINLDKISNDLESLICKKSVDSKPLTLIEFLNKSEKNLGRLSEFYANICTRLELAYQTIILPDIEIFIQWILIIEDAKRKIKKIKQQNKFIYYY